MEGNKNQAAFVLGLAYPGTSKVLGFVFLFCFWRQNLVSVALNSVGVGERRKERREKRERDMPLIPALKRQAGGSLSLRAIWCTKMM